MRNKKPTGRYRSVSFNRLDRHWGPQSQKVKTLSYSIKAGQNTSNIFVQVVAQQILRSKLRLFVACITTSAFNKFLVAKRRRDVNILQHKNLLRVLLPPHLTHFHFAESRRRVFFLQHENLLNAEVVIRATNNLNLQCNICCGTTCMKMLLALLGRNEMFH